MRYLSRSIAIVLMALTVLGASQCSHTNSSILTQPDFQTSLAIEDANGNTTTTFAQGQLIQFVVSVYNNNPVPLVVLVHSCVPPVLVVVENASTSQVIFGGSSSGPICQWGTTQGVPTTVAAPHQTASFPVTWNQLVPGLGQSAPPGIYNVMAFFVCPYPPAANGPGGNYDTADCQAVKNFPPLNQFSPSALRSAVMQFTIQ